MSQIKAKSLVALRGHAYQCLYCRPPKVYIQEKRRVEAHVYKHHIALERAPYYCKLCLFRCATQDELERHVLNFKIHRDRQSQQPADYDVQQDLLKSNDPYYLTARDIKCLSAESSEDVWKKRERQSSTPSYGPSAPFFSTVGRPSTTPVQDENIWDDIMGSTQYSEGMRLSPNPPAGLQTPCLRTATPSSVDSSGIGDSLPTSPAFAPLTTINVAALRTSPRMTSRATATFPNPHLCTNPMPSLSTPIDVRNIVVDPHVTQSTSQNNAEQTFFQPIQPLSMLPGTISFPTATIGTLPPMSTFLSRPAPSTESTSPVLRNVYTPTNPAFEQTSYVPTVCRRSAGCQTDGSLVLDRVVNAVDDLNKTLHNTLTGLGRLMENQTIAIGAIHTQIKNYVRTQEEDSNKRRAEEETKPKKKPKHH